jgi:hypothetical protein
VKKYSNAEAVAGLRVARGGGIHPVVEHHPESYRKLGQTGQQEAIGARFCPNHNVRIEKLTLSAVEAQDFREQGRTDFRVAGLDFPAKSD